MSPSKVGMGNSHAFGRRSIGHAVRFPFWTPAKSFHKFREEQPDKQPPSDFCPKHFIWDCKCYCQKKIFNFSRQPPDPVQVTPRSPHSRNISGNLFWQKHSNSVILLFPGIIGTKRGRQWPSRNRPNSHQSRQHDQTTPHFKTCRGLVQSSWGLPSIENMMWPMKCMILSESGMRTRYNGWLAESHHSDNMIICL